jgi:hypothetical protein
MICEYRDGLKVHYSGTLQITKGKDVNVLIKEDFIPSNIKSGLDKAASHHSCSDLRKVADDVRATYGNRVCVH